MLVTKLCYEIGVLVLLTVVAVLLSATAHTWFSSPEYVYHVGR